MLATVPTRVPRAVREQQMLDAAVAEFADRGYVAASMEDIATRAGITKPMVYAYLGTKEELFLACLRREGTRLMEALVAVVRPQLSAEDQLWQGLRAFYLYVTTRRDGWTVLHRRGRGLAPFGDDLAQMRARMVDIVTGMLGRAVADRGRTPNADDVEAMAYALVGAAESVADWLVDHEGISADRAATRMMSAVWLGAESLLRGEYWRHPTL
jgi:AcrR family transcriptional regulator